MSRGATYIVDKSQAPPPTPLATSSQAAPVGPPQNKEVYWPRLKVTPLRLPTMLLESEGVTLEGRMSKLV